jgi:hypothetical protein
MHRRIVATGEYLNLDQAAARSGVSRATLRSWINRGRFPSAHKKLHDGDLSPMEKWFILYRELEAVLGCGLYPTRFDLITEVEGLEETLQQALTKLDDGAQPHDDLRFALQVLRDLRAQLEGEPTS